MFAFRVLIYSIDTLVDCLAEYSLATKEEVVQKLHRQYFSDYFFVLDAKTIVIEPYYIDHDFLEDFAAYYVRCFENYKRTTTRLHFFNTEFTEEQFRSVLIDSKSELNSHRLQESYLGFVVIKPLPQTLIGRTCLKTYPEDNSRREYPILRRYPANLFGISLEIDSLAYQEQDTVVAACATSALWSCFQGTGKLFQHAIPSPVEITKVATRQVPENLPANNARAFPNDGLTATQMALAIRDVGLEPYIVGTNNFYILNCNLYAYIRCKIPLILAFRLSSVGKDGKQEPMGAHAVTITGFSLGRTNPKPLEKSGFLLRALRIDKIYAHDDQIGPFAKMTECFSSREYLETSWQIGCENRIEALPWFLLLPLYHKIRIPFEVIHDAIHEVDAAIEKLREKIKPEPTRQEWDIYLTTVSDFKNDVFNSMRSILGKNTENTLTANLPKFLWRVTVWRDSQRQLELLFDATGIAQHQLLVHVIELKTEVSSTLCGVAPNVIGTLKNLQAEAIFRHFAPAQIQI